MLTVDDLAIARGGRTLVRDLSFAAGPGQRVGVLGPNGCGKSSLFASLIGELEPEQGAVALPEGWTIALARQASPGGTEGALSYVQAGDAALARAHEALGNAEPGGGDALAAAHAAFDAAGGYTAEARAASLLHGLGFAPGDEDRSLDTFSGGWRSRLALARTLFASPDLLLLDEPTNHLDLPTIDWLAGWLTEFPGLVLCISHDRDFLDRVATHVLWIDRPAPRYYAGNLSVAEARRAQVLANEARERAKSLQRAAELQAFVDRFRAKATKARQAQSRLKMLERLEISAPLSEYAGYRFTFPDPERVSSPLLALDHADLGYDGEILLSDVHLSILPGDRIGLVGANGAGKSTLVKALAGRGNCVVAGERRPGQHLRVGYFAQHQLDQLDPGATPLEHLRRREEAAPEQMLRDFLGRFGFHGDAAVEPIAPRSGGEKARLALALLAWQRPNLLLLDEPTNHLDLQMRDALALALQAFGGAVVLVSHDRAFLESLSDRLLRVGDGRVTAVASVEAGVCTGGGSRAGPSSAAGPVEKGGAGGDSKRERRQQAAAERGRLRPLRERVRRLERDLESGRKRLEAVQATLADPALYGDEARAGEIEALSREAGELEAQLGSLEEAWFEAQETLEAAR